MAVDEELGRSGKHALEEGRSAPAPGRAGAGAAEQESRALEGLTLGGKGAVPR